MEIKENTEKNISEKLLLEIADVKKDLKSISEEVLELKKRLASVDSKNDLNNIRSQIFLWQLYRTAGEDERNAKLRFFKSLSKATGKLRKIQMTGFVLLREFDKICKENDINYWLGFGSLLGAVRHGGFIPWDDDIDVCMLRSEFDRLMLAMQDDEEFICYEIFGLHGPKRCVLNHGFKVRFKNYGTSCTLDIFIFDEARQLKAEQVKSINDLKSRLGSEGQKLSMNPGTASQWNVRCRSGSKEFDECKILMDSFLEKYFGIIKEGHGERKLIWSIDNLILGWGENRQISYDLVFPLRRIDFEGYTFPCPNNNDEYLSIMYGDYLSVPNDMLSHKHFEMSEKHERDYEKIYRRFLKE